MEILKEEIFSGFIPELVIKGNNLFEFKVKPRKEIDQLVVFRFSYNLIPSPLSSLISIFNQDRKVNNGKRTLLEENDFLTGRMMPETKSKFDEWFSDYHSEQFLCNKQRVKFVMKLFKIHKIHF